MNKTPITKLPKDSPEYQEAVDSVKKATEKRSVTVNYKELADTILNSEEGEAIKLEVNRQNYSNVKRNLEKRGVILDTHYSMASKKEDDAECIYITVKG